MAQRRKVSNLMALAILSVVARQPMHPYEMARTLRAWGKDQDIEIKWGSLYTVVGNMAKHGLLEAVGSTRAGRRPERTVYRITESGRAELVDWARELISSPHREYPRFRAGLSVLSVLPPEEVVNLLRQRLATLEAEIAALRESLVQHGEQVPRLFLIETEYALAVQEAEASWVRSFLNDLTAGTFPDLPAWRMFHERGELPAEFTEFAEQTQHRGSVASGHSGAKPAVKRPEGMSDE